MMVCDQSKQKFWALFLILSATFLVFSGSLGNQFTNWDDGFILVNNNEVHELSFGNLKKIFSENYVGTYIPLTILSFNIEYFFFQNSSFIYYLDNLLLHLAGVALVFILGQRFGLSLMAASFAALLFAIHPLHVESVAWVSQRKDVLYSFFYLLALLKYLDFLSAAKKNSYSWALFFGFCSILAKPMAYSLPLILFLCDWWYKRKISWKVIGEKVPFVFVIGLVSLITYSSNSQTLAFSFYKCLLVWVWVFIFHIQKFFFPYPLLTVYEIPQPISFTNFEYPSAFAAFACLISILLLIRRQRWLWLAVLFYLLSNLMIIVRSVWDFGNNTVVADRFMYLPSLGFCLAFGVLYHSLYERLKKAGRFYGWLCLFLAAVFFLILSLRLTYQVAVWRNNITLWSNVLKYNPNNPIALANRAAAYTDEERYDLAIQDWNNAIKLVPKNAIAYYARAEIFEKTKDFQNALLNLNQAQMLDSADANINFLRGKIYQTLGDTNSALKEYSVAIEKDPSLDRAFYNRGIIFDQMGSTDLALADYNQVSAITAVHPKVYNNRAVIYINQGEHEKALADLLKAIKIDPKNAQAYGNLGNLAFLKQDYASAFTYFEKSILLDPGFSEAYVSRAIIYALTQKNDLALADLNRAIVLDAKNANAYFTRALFNYNSGNISLVEQDLDKALAIDSHNVKAQNLKRQLGY